MDDPIASFMMIADCSDEGTAIEILSEANFDVQTAVAIYAARKGGGGGGGPSTTRAPRASTTAFSSSVRPAPPVRRRSEDDVTYAYDEDEDAELARALAASQNDFGGGSSSQLQHRELRAEDYRPTAQRIADIGSGGGAGRGLFLGGATGGSPYGNGGGGVGSAGISDELNKNLMAIDEGATFDEAFLTEHFGTFKTFWPPNWGCESRYVYHGVDPSLSREQNFGLEANPIITHFKYCCGIAEKQRKYVFLLILRGDRTFCDGCCIRDLLSTRSASSAFLKENFLTFIQVVFPGSLEHVRNTKLSNLQIHQKNVKRMMNLNSFLSTYQIGTSPEENLLPGGRFPSRVETEEQRRVYRVFCANPFPVLAIIDPQTQSLVKRIPVGSLYKVRNNAAEFDADALMEELTQSMESNMIGDNFFLREESTVGGGGAGADYVPSSSSTSPLRSSGSNPFTAKPSATVPVYTVGDDDDAQTFGNKNNTDDANRGGGEEDEYGDDYDYDYYDDNYDQDVEVLGDKPARKATQQTAANNDTNDNTNTTTVAATSGSLSPPPPPPLARIVTSTVIDIAPFCAPAVASSDCMKLRIGTPKGQVVIEVSKKIPVKLLIVYLTALCTTGSSHKMLTAVEAASAIAASSNSNNNNTTSATGNVSPLSSTVLSAGGGITPTPPSSPLPPPQSTSSTTSLAASNNGNGNGGGVLTAFTFDAELAKIVFKTKFLGGFPPRPIDIDSEAFLAPIAALGEGESEGVSVAQSSERIANVMHYLAGDAEVSLESWGKIRANDSIRPSLS